MNNILQEALAIIMVDVENDQVVVTFDQSKNLPELLLNTSQIRLAMINILRNAYQAIDGEGFIHIRTLYLDNNVRIRISDSGTGISGEEIGRIFDPFFTTKETGKGMGIGLYVSFQIIQSHKGEITVESNYGKGTVFTIDFPLLEVNADE